MEDWRWMTAADLGRGIASGEIDPVALTEVYLQAIESHPESGRIYASVTADRARKEAEASAKRAQSGQRLSTLDGVPISWKDLFDTKDIPTEAGTLLMAGRVPDKDAKTVALATATGLVCLGKTHLSEIAFSGLGVNPITETPPCVNDSAAAPGGSSSGAAASVAFGLAAAAIGSDTGGSVRIPSAWNDLTGLKTSHGRVPTTGVVPLCESFDTVGPLCRSVEDTSILLGILEGQAATDLKKTSLAGCHFALLDTIVLDDLEDRAASAYENATKRLEAAGATLHRLSVKPMHDAFAVAGALYTADSWSWWRGLITANPEKMYYQIYDRIKVGADVPAADYVDGWRRLHRVRVAYRSATAGFDAVLMPSCPIMPPPVDRLLADPAYYLRSNLLALRNTRVANLMDVPSMSLPTGIPSCGIMINGQNRNEEKLLRVAQAAEAALA